MGFLRDTALAVLYGPAAPSRAAKAGPLAAQQIPAGVQGRAAYPATDPATLLRAYSQNELVYACVNRRARSAIGPRLVVQRRAGDAEWAEVPGHPFRTLWGAPNPTMTDAGLLSAIIVSLDVAGVFYGEMVRSASGAPVAIYPLNPAQVFPVPSDRNTVDSYEFRDGTTKIRIPAADMLVKRDYSPAAPAWGHLSRLAVCLGTVDADQAQTDYVRAFFNNAGVPSGILTVPGQISQEQADVLRAKWRERFGRLWGQQHDIAVLDENATYTQLGTNLDQLDSEIMRSIFESRVCMTFEVPPLIIYAYVGLLRATYSNLKEAWASFWEATLDPLYEDLRVWLQGRLLAEFVPAGDLAAERLRLAWDFTKVAAKQDDETAKHSRAKEAFVAGGLTLNEYRNRLGEPPDPAGDYYLRTIAQVEVPQGAAPDPGTGKGAIRPYGAKAAPPRPNLAPVEARLEAAAAAYLTTQYERAAAAVEAGG